MFSLGRSRWAGKAGPAGLARLACDDGAFSGRQGFAVSSGRVHPADRCRSSALPSVVIMCPSRMTPEQASRLSLAEQYEWFARAAPGRPAPASRVTASRVTASAVTASRAHGPPGDPRPGRPGAAGPGQAARRIGRAAVRSAHRVRGRPHHADVGDLAGSRASRQPVPAGRVVALGSGRADSRGNPDHNDSAQRHPARRPGVVDRRVHRAALRTRRGQRPAAGGNLLLQHRSPWLGAAAARPCRDLHHRAARTRAVYLHGLRRSGRQPRRGEFGGAGQRPEPGLPPARRGHLLCGIRRPRPDHRRLRPAGLGLVLHRARAGGRACALAGRSRQSRAGGLVLG